LLGCRLTTASTVRHAARDEPLAGIKIALASHVLTHARVDKLRHIIVTTEDICI